MKNKNYIIYIFIVFFVIFLILFLNKDFLYKNGKNIDEKNINEKTLNKEVNSNEKKSLCSSLIENNTKKVNNNAIKELLSSYLSIKNSFLDAKVLNEYVYEFKVVKAFHDNDCKIIYNLDSDNYTYNLCNIYVNKELTKLDSFNFKDGDSKEEFISTFKSLYQGKLLNGAKESTFLSINNFNKNKENINFEFQKTSSLRADYYIYYIENGKNQFFGKLNEQFLEKCKLLNNEK